MIHVPSSELKFIMMDIEKQSDGSDCGVLDMHLICAVAWTLALFGLITDQTTSSYCLKNC